MKELSVEQKAKAYDKAIEKANELLYVSDKDSLQRKIVEHIFSELKESENEQHRKWILECLYDGLRKSDGQFKDQFKCAIAWLEKQGNLMKALQFANKTIGELTDENYYLREKLNEQKPYGQREECVDCQCNYAGECKGFCGIKQGEQKPTDKVEPKFHEGEWIVWQDKCYKVNYNGCGYELVDQNGLSTSLEYGTVDENARVFTIQDAKDGDVLCTYECCEPKIVFILKGTPKKHYALSYHCYYNIMYPHFTSDSEKGCLAPNDEDVKPATKEQRDLLFQRMKEAGYEWDAAKKKLEKIEQKPAEDVDLPEFESYLCLMFQKFRIKGMCTNGEIIDYVKEHSQKLKDILVKPTWNEEDELHIRELERLVKQAWAIAEHENDKETIHKMSNLSFFLKTLKPQPQPKQEWSEEDK